MVADNYFPSVGAKNWLHYSIVVIPFKQNERARCDKLGETNGTKVFKAPASVDLFCSLGGINLRLRTHRPTFGGMCIRSDGIGLLLGECASEAITYCLNLLVETVYHE